MLRFYIQLITRTINPIAVKVEKANNCASVPSKI